MFEPGQHVRIGRHGVSVFVVLEVDDNSVRIESIEDALGRYPFRMRAIDLVPADLD